jgi:hypothetical protein
MYNYFKKVTVSFENSILILQLKVDDIWSLSFKLPFPILVSVSRVHVKKDEDFEHPPGGYRP